MAKLNGQNFRVLVWDSEEEKYRCIAKSTGATITLTANTEDASTKDDVSMAARPIVTSLSWQVQVDSMDVSDVTTMLAAIKSLTPFTLIWDEVSTSDNQTALKAAFSRKGTAYLSDLTLTFNDREISTKSIQFSGISELEKLATTPTVDVYTPDNTYTRGQYVRMFLGSDNTTTPTAVVAYARQLSMHVSMQLENSTTKDTPGSWMIQEPVGLSYDISTTALTRSGDTITSAVAGKTLADIEDIYESQNPVKFQIANVSGDNNRTKGAVIVEGSITLTSLTLNEPNRQSSDYSAQFNGVGIYTVTTPSES